ncbi:MAG: hypothetical protein GX075_07275 [Firmicutes bacterium]|nr:hypothetical protein [Bacillota bacterium]
MTLVYLIFGKEFANHIQANFSILSMLTQREEIDSINVVTDNPTFYNRLAGVINVINVEQEVLQEWKGKNDFFWRVKIKAIELLANIYKNKHLLYLDSDTFLFGNLKYIKEKLDEGFSFMHLNEGKLSQLRSKTEKRMWQQTSNKDFGPVKINQNHCMWNAGVIGIPGNKSAELIKATLDICDAMLERNITRRLIEQLAFSLALSEFSQLIPAENHIGHYWGNKEEWQSFIVASFLKSYFGNTTLNEQIESFKSLDYTKIPIALRIPNTRRRLFNLITKLFPEKDKRYIIINKE